MDLIKLLWLNDLSKMTLWEITEGRVRVLWGILIFPWLVVRVLAFAEHGFKVVLEDKGGGNILSSHTSGVHIGVVTLSADHFLCE